MSDLPKSNDSEESKTSNLREATPEDEIRSAISTFTAFRGPMHPAVYEKINADHIHKILDQSEKDDQRGI